MATSTRTGAAGAAGRRWQQPVRLTALYHEHVGREAQMAEHDGWLLPRHYGDAQAERATVRRAAGLLDLGEAGIIDLKSTALDGVLSTAFPTAGRVQVGRWVEAGDGAGTWIARLTADQALLFTPPGTADATAAALRRAADHPCTHVVDLTGARCNLRLLGTAAPAVLERLCALDLSVDRFPHGSVVQSGVARIHALIARRDAGDLPGYDLSVDRDLGAYLWHALLEAGTPLGLAPVGRDVEEAD
jgi:glycine cleavage system T protein (aminomethyltransferase)